MAPGPSLRKRCSSSCGPVAQAMPNLGYAVPELPRRVAKEIPIRHHLTLEQCPITFRASEPAQITSASNGFILRSTTSAHRLTQRVAGWVGGRHRRPEPEAHLLSDGCSAQTHLANGISLLRYTPRLPLRVCLGLCGHRRINSREHPEDFSDHRLRMLLLDVVLR